MIPKRPVTFNHNPLLEKGLPAWRPRVVLFLMLLGAAALIGRAAYLQGVNNEFLQAKGESRYSRVIEVPATRGRILDRNGDVMASSTPMRSIWAIPADAKLTPSEARQLALLLDVEVDELHRRLARERDFVYLKRLVSPDTAQQVALLQLPGIHQQREYRRYYPMGEVAAHVLGFTDISDQGQEGIELAFNSDLAGHPGTRRVIRDRRGQIIEDTGEVRAPRDGRDVRLTIDSKLQFLTYSALLRAVEQHQARAGAAVVLDVRSGEVLALANVPAFNPNNRASLSGAQLRNRVVTDIFEPGSTIKPFVASLALEQGKVSPETVIDTGSGHMRMGSATISDWRSLGVLTVSQVIQKSSNIGMVKLSAGLSPEDMWGLFNSLGFGAPLGLGFPGEAAGKLRPAHTWKPVEQATMSYGYGMSVSLMQLAHAYLVFTRDGELVPVSLTPVEGEPVDRRRIFSISIARQMRHMLEMAAGPGGAGAKARIPGYLVAGKSGTARKLEGGHYTSKYISSFVGFAPASDPRIVVAVMIDEPSTGGYYGSAVAAPVFARITGEILRTQSVAPDAPLAPLKIAGPADTAEAAREHM